LVNSTVVAERVRSAYGIEPNVVAPPTAIDNAGRQRAVCGVEPGFLLCVARLLPYKNIDVALEAMRSHPDESLLVVGSGPDRARLEAMRPVNVTFLEAVEDDELRWLYASCVGLLALSHEDFGLTPIEAASFGKPTLALRDGGYLDTILEGHNGLFVNRVDPQTVSDGIGDLRSTAWDATAIRASAERFSRLRFAAAIEQIVDC
jgi:glycosyltransferase involved in cell wall biosynthesis